MSELAHPFDAARDHWRGGEGVEILEYGDYECLDRDELWQRVREDATSAVASGAWGTPTLFLNGRLHSGSYDHDTLRATLDPLKPT